MSTFKSVFALLLALNVSNLTLAAPVQWQLSDGGNAHFYDHVLPPSGITWTNAQVAAASSSFLGVPGHLVTVNSQAEWDFVIAEFPIDWTWIGFTDQEQEGDFRWVTGEPVTFTRWIPNEPNNAGNEDYVFFQMSSGLGGDFGWNDFKNFNNVFTSLLPIGYVVEYPVAEDEPEPGPPFGPPFEPPPPGPPFGDPPGPPFGDPPFGPPGGPPFAPHGDGNLNGVVEAADYTLWANGFGGASPQFSDGDYNVDGSVDAADYTLWANNFGMMAAPETSAAAAVPEPSTFALSALGLLGFFACSSRRRRRV